MFHIQYEIEFANQIVAAPQHIRDEFKEMVLELQMVPHSGDVYSVIESTEVPGVYYMLCSDTLAWIVYTVDTNHPKMVTVFRLVNSRDLVD